MIPGKIKIRGHVYTVVLSAEPMYYQGRKCRGIYDPNVKTIYVWQNQRPLKLMATLVHEYLHAVADAYKLKIPHKLIYAVEEPLARLILLVIDGVTGTPR